MKSHTFIVMLSFLFFFSCTNAKWLFLFFFFFFSILFYCVMYADFF